MIAILSQDKTSISHNRVTSSGRKIWAQIDTSQMSFPVAEYETEEQAAFVFDQIASAIDREDRLYRMPSVERVTILIDKPCELCRSKNIKVPNCGEGVYCNYCRDKNYWLLKEEE